MPRIGIMQGRLGPPLEGRFQCFPRGCWRDEFPLAAQAGLDSIEWVYDQYGEDVNPLATAEGIAAMLACSGAHGVTVRSVCADYFMDRPLLRVSPEERMERLDRLAWLLDCCRQAGIGRMVLPFVDASRIESPQDFEEVVGAIRHVLPVAERVGVEIHLETSLAPRPFADLLDALPHRLVRVNYDSGNSSGLGYAPADEFAAYGPRVGSVHIKDRILGGGTVPLGTGSADFAALFACLRESRYAGDFILQVARDVPGHEVDWAVANRSFVVACLERGGCG